MTAAWSRRYGRVTCDGCGDVLLVAHPVSMAVILKTARLLGWHIKPHLDLCPECKHDLAALMRWNPRL